MRKKNIGLILKRSALVSLCFMVTLISVVIIPPAPKAEAALLSLQSMVDSLSTCKNVSKGTDQWNKCEETQNLLYYFARCSNKMFAPEDDNGKRSIGQATIDDCQKKINSNERLQERTNYLLKTVRDCKDVVKTAGEKGSIDTLVDDDKLDPKDWDQCESAQIGLVKLYGSKCDNLFDTIDRTLAKDKATFNVERTDACEAQTKAAQKPATNPGDGAASEKKKDDEQVDNCNDSIKNLGWIMCPVIEIGISATDKVFQDFIEPMLENVPVSTEADNGAYLAWKQFRILGNIILIGSLLAVVYAQARGDR